MQPASSSAAWMAGLPSASGRDGHHGELAATATLEGQAAATVETSPGDADGGWPLLPGETRGGAVARARPAVRDREGLEQPR
ncbi:hypothetical protein U9M48_043568 [Paspalum notatum var. saurae]|uniref:Uncharacterized protein n=1 Tax=Paspalum notatum var. saurae TaxID=547442 RepID=A0AAQ3UUY2_PASNO